MTVEALEIIVGRVAAAAGPVKAAPVDPRRERRHSVPSAIDVEGSEVRTAAIGVAVEAVTVDVAAILAPLTAVDALLIIVF